MGYCIAFDCKDAGGRATYGAVAEYELVARLGVDVIFIAVMLLVVFLRFCVLRYLSADAWLELPAYPRLQALDLL